MAAKKVVVKKAAPKVAPGVATSTDPNAYLNDSTYIATQSSLAKALSQYQNNLTQEGSDYDTTYNQDLKNLGFDTATKQWNQTDPLTQSGKAFTGQLQDFASRGMLHSSGYAENYSTLGRQLGQQVDNAANAAQKYHNDLNAQGSAYADQNQDQLTQAKLQAIARKAASAASAASGVLNK